MRSRWTEYIEKIADLTLSDLWHKGDFLKKLTFEDKFSIIENNSLKKKFQLLFLLLCALLF